MKLIIAGGRDLYRYYGDIEEDLQEYNIELEEITEIVSGNCRGIDKCGETFAEEHFIHIERFPPDWDTHGKAAGPIRNRQMAEYADALLLIWNGKSRGSAIMKKEMKKLDKPVYEVIL